MNGDDKSATFKTAKVLMCNMWK